MAIISKYIFLAIYIGCFYAMNFGWVWANDVEHLNDYGFEKAYQYFKVNNTNIYNAYAKNAGVEPILELKSFLYNDVFKYIEKEKINDPQNIVAIESVKKVFKLAQKDLADNNLSVSLVNLSLADYLKKNKAKFYIIYFDACGPFMGGKPNTLMPVLEAIVNDSLSSRCALISNYSDVPLEKKGRYISLCSGYFAPRVNDLPESFHNSGIDSAEAQYMPEILQSYVENNLDDFYGDFITRFTIDICRYILPSARAITSTPLRKKLIAHPRKAVDAVLSQIFCPKTIIDKSDDKFNLHDWTVQSLHRHTWEICPSSYPLYSFLEGSWRRAWKTGPLRQPTGE